MYTGLLANLAILVLAGFVGFAVISSSSNTLHTPLVGHQRHPRHQCWCAGRARGPSADANWGVRIIAFVALVFGTLNIGGFAVTDRMLDVQGQEGGREVTVETNFVGGHTPNQGVSYAATALYILAFGLFIYGLSGLTGPAIAVRGNWIAAVGMGIAVAATLLYVWNEGARSDDGIGRVAEVPTIN